MALKIKFAVPSRNQPWTMAALRIALVVIAVVAVAGIAFVAFYYHRYEEVVNARLKQPLFEQTAKIYAAAREVRPGQKLNLQLLARELRLAGYTDDTAAKASPLGTYTLQGQSLIVRPGPQSFHSEDSATIRISGGQVQSISDEHGQGLSSYELEPLLITGLSEDASRTKRRLMTYDEIPPNLVQAVLAIDRKSTRLNSSHYALSRMPSSA